MIYLYSGTPGSGKSLHQASNIYNGLKFTRSLFICNYEINTSCIKHMKGQFLFLDNQDLKPDKLIALADVYFESHKFKEGAIKLYIDESQILFNSREWNIVGRREWISFFTQHRKFGYDIYLIAQFDRMLDRQIRSLIEYECIHRKLSNFGFKGKVLSLLFGGSTFVAVSVWYPMKEKTGHNFFHYRRKFSRLYDTYKRFNSDETKPSQTPG